LLSGAVLAHPFEIELDRIDPMSAYGFCIDPV
jgi:hypothetical protein